MFTQLVLRVQEQAHLSKKAIESIDQNHIELPAPSIRNQPPEGWAISGVSLKSRINVFANDLVGVLFGMRPKSFQLSRDAVTLGLFGGGDSGI
jgi:hypothetical protein